MIEQPQTDRGRLLGYLPGLDGLRAFAVIVVLLYHADVAWLPGGFLGVEVFFVLSGYLITALLVAEWQRYGSIKLGRFWLRRARRLLPGLFLLLLALLSYAIVLLPAEVARLRDDVLAALGYVTNWFLIVRRQPYFETAGRQSLLQHLWSLAVEEQFYLLWPIVLSLGLLAGRRVMLLLTLGGVALSALLMALLYQPAADPSRVYYGTDTRAAGLLAGAALALAWLPRARPTPYRLVDRVLLDLLGIEALVALIWIFVQVDPNQPWLYRGGFLLIDGASAVLIYVVSTPTRVRALFSLAPLRLIGQRAYSLYLWHWPVFMLTRPRLDLPLDGQPLLLVRLALTIVLAELSYRYVEQPVRGGIIGRIWRAVSATSGAEQRWLKVGWYINGVLGIVFSAVLVFTALDAPAPAPPVYFAVSAVHSVRSTSVPTPTVLPAPARRSAQPYLPAAIREQKVVLSVPVTPTAAPAIATPTAAMPPTQEPMAQPTLPAALPEGAPSPGRVSAVGDSVMLGAYSQFQARLGDLQFDAQVNRQVPAALDILRAWQAADQLGDVVVVHIGNNGAFTPPQFADMMTILRDVPQVLVVNTKVPRSWQDRNNALIAEQAAQYSNVRLVDWYGASIDRPEYFWDDGIHLRPEGAQAYTDLLLAQLARR